jgi:DNA-binding transcriptional LysR family regulator
VVRITAVDALASHYLARQLADLRSRYPELAIEIIASSKSLDLVRREADIAVRLARPADGDLVVRCLGRLAYGVYGPEKPCCVHPGRPRRGWATSAPSTSCPRCAGCPSRSASTT